jgi:hypothetical protein
MLRFTEARLRGTIGVTMQLMRGITTRSPIRTALRSTAAFAVAALLILPGSVSALAGQMSGPVGAIRLDPRGDTISGGTHTLWLSDASGGSVTQAGISSEAVSAMLRPAAPDRAARVSPALAFLMSAALPGTGQLAEGRNRAFAYLGAEAFAWIAHFSWKDASRKKEQESEAFADRHWDYADWKEHASDPECFGAIPPGLNEAELQEAILSQRASNADSYYASLSKQDGYRGGWDDFNCEAPDGLSANRRAFSGMRQDSNDFLARARLATTFVFLNRIVSAVDAYRTARGARLSLSPRTHLELDVKGSLTHPRAALRLRRGL